MVIASNCTANAVDTHGKRTAKRYGAHNMRKTMQDTALQAVDMNERKTAQRTFRISPQMDNDVKALAREGETITAAYMRVIEAGITAINGGGSCKTGEDTGGQLVDALNANIDTLREQLEHEREQVLTYRAQLDAALHLVSQEQGLRLLEAKRTDQAEDGNEGEYEIDDTPSAEETPRPETRADDTQDNAQDGTQDDARPLTLGGALRCWMNGTPVKISL